MSLNRADETLRLATWNVNSIRTRVDRVVDWLARADVDVLAMQETKCTDAQFPTMPFAALGYEVVHVGVNQWNGVAIASRVGLDNIEVGFDGQPTWSAKPDVSAAAEARALGATCGGIRVWSLYVPNGRTLDDPHYTYKLNWLAALRDTASGWLKDDPSTPIALVGDWNIAPTDDDVWNVDFFQGSTHVSAPERAAFEALVDAPGCTPTGITRSYGSPGKKGCGSISSSAPPPWLTASCTPRSFVKSEKARRPAITHRSWWT
jgi:exodeoxyribonuclease-3